jgi:hypothetical protein
VLNIQICVGLIVHLLFVFSQIVHSYSNIVGSWPFEDGLVPLYLVGGVKSSHPSYDLSLKKPI